MAFPTGWNRICKLTVQHGQVPADQTAFPVLITEATLPSEILVSGGANAAQSDGGDIRFSTDPSGSNQIACEIVLWDQTGGKAEIWIPVSILTATNVDIYIWYNAGGGLSQPAVNASFGAQAVWDANFKSVYHGGDGSSVGLTDSTGRANLTNHSFAAATGKVGGCFSSSAADKYASASDTSLPSGSGARTMGGWMKVTSTWTLRTLLKYGTSGTTGAMSEVRAEQGDIKLEGWSADMNATMSPHSTNTWYYFICTFDGTNGRVYQDGAQIGSGNGGGPTSLSWNTVLDGTLYIGHTTFGGSGGDIAEGALDEIRISNIARSANWITTEYNNQNSPSTFVVAGTPGFPTALLSNSSADTLTTFLDSAVISAGTPNQYGLIKSDALGLRDSISYQGPYTLFIGEAITSLDDKQQLILVLHKTFNDSVNNFLDAFSKIVGIPIRAFDSQQFNWGDVLNKVFSSVLEVIEADSLNNLVDSASTKINNIPFNITVSDMLTSMSDAIRIFNTLRILTEDNYVISDALRLRFALLLKVAQVLSPLSDSATLLRTQKPLFADTIANLSDGVSLALSVNLNVLKADILGLTDSVKYRLSGTYNSPSFADRIRRYLNDLTSH